MLTRQACRPRPRATGPPGLHAWEQRRHLVSLRAGKPVAADAGCSQRESRLLREGKAGESGSLRRGPAVGTPVVQAATGAGWAEPK